MDLCSIGKSFHSPFKTVDQVSQHEFQGNIFQFFNLSIVFNTTTSSQFGTHRHSTLNRITFIKVYTPLCHSRAQHTQPYHFHRGIYSSLSLTGTAHSTVSLSSRYILLSLTHSLYKVTTFQTMWNSLTIPWQFAALLRGTRHVKHYSYHAHTNTKYLYGRKYAAYNKSFRQLFSDKIFSLTFPWFLSASLYVSKRGAYWDRLCCDVVGWLVVTRVHCDQTVHPRPIVTMEH